MRDTTANRTTLRLIEVIIALSAAVSFVFGVVRPFLGGFGLGSGPLFGRPAEVDVTLDRNELQVLTEPALPVLAGRPQGVQSGDALEFQMPFGTEIAVWSVNAPQGIGLVGGQVLTGTVIVASLLVLLLIVRNFRRGYAFTPANAKKLFILAILITVGGQGAAILTYWGTLAVLTHPDVEPFVVQDAHLSLVPLIIGIGLFLVAEVFRQGVKLQHEVNQTV